MSILKPIIYFSVFNHPLTEDETFLFSDAKNKNEVSNELNKLTSKGIISKIDDFLLIENKTSHIKKRISGNDNAKKVMPKVKKVASFIAKFPFVRGVSVSGSLSKGYYDADSDFDFFVITQAKRVWLSRLFFAIYKRIYLKNSYKEFCVNYFVSTSTLEIEEKNRFTATEIATIIPMFGKLEFTAFYQANKWIKHFLPNQNISEKKFKIDKIKKPISIQLIEFIFNNPLGTAINYGLMKIISNRWKYRYKKKTNNPYKAKNDISKHQPDNFQEQVLRKVNEKYNYFEKEYGINIEREIA